MSHRLTAHAILRRARSQARTSKHAMVLYGLWKIFLRQAILVACLRTGGSECSPPGPRRARPDGVMAARPARTSGPAVRTAVPVGHFQSYSCYY
eukprot:scaffold181033_cov23-Prasinocladus_malaysianus.AAC.1